MVNEVGKHQKLFKKKRSLMQLSFRRLSGLREAKKQGAYLGDYGGCNSGDIEDVVVLVNKCGDGG